MRKIFYSIFILFSFLFFSSPSYAVDLSVEAPSETLVRGSTFDFKIYIDTKGSSIAKQSMIFTYDKTAVEFADIVEAGDFFDSVGYQPDTGKILIVGESAKAKSGTGLVATVKMRIIAQSAGSTQLCSVIPLDVTPSPTVGPSKPVTPTKKQTAPQSGNILNMAGGTVFGLFLMMLSITVLLVV